MKPRKWKARRAPKMSLRRQLLAMSADCRQAADALQGILERNSSQAVASTRRDT